MKIQKAVSWYPNCLDFEFPEPKPKRAKELKTIMCQTLITSDQIIKLMRNSPKTKSPNLTNAFDGSDGVIVPMHEIDSLSAKSIWGEKPKVKNIGIQTNLRKSKPSRIDMKLPESGAETINDFSSNQDRRSSKNLRAGVHPKPVKNVRIKLLETSKITESDDSQHNSHGEALTSTDRMRLRKIKKYEHKFQKSSDVGRSVSPKTVKRRGNVDYFQRETGFYEPSHSPENLKLKTRDFSPILARKHSEPEMLQLSMTKMLDRYQTCDEKQFVALSGKILNFK